MKFLRARIQTTSEEATAKGGCSSLSPVPVPAHCCVNQKDLPAALRPLYD